MTYCFRARFVLGPHVKLNISETDWILTGAAPPEVVSLRSPDRTTLISESNTLVLRGSGYAEEQEAIEGASRWCSIFQVAFARLGIGADFGERAAKSAFTELGLRQLEQEHGHRILNDVHGVMTFDCDPEARFVSLGGTLSVSRPENQVRDAIEFALSAGVSLTDRQRLAYDLFSGSFFQQSPDARYLMLMMSLETLITPKPRFPEAQAFIDQLIDHTQRSGLERREIDSMVGTLNGLRKESVSQAGRRLTKSLGDRLYMSERPSVFFTNCYELRSRLVHGQHPRPSPGEVGVRAASLETFVGHIISGPLLDGVET